MLFACGFAAVIGFITPSQKPAPAPAPRIWRRHMREFVMGEDTSTAASAWTKAFQIRLTPPHHRRDRD
jgi:hypothetical protein